MKRETWQVKWRPKYRGRKRGGLLLLWSRRDDQIFDTSHPPCTRHCWGSNLCPLAAFDTLRHYVNSSTQQRRAFLGTSACRTDTRKGQSSRYNAAGANVLGLAHTLLPGGGAIFVEHVQVCDTVEGGQRSVTEKQRRDTIVITSAVYLARPQEKLASTLDWPWFWQCYENLIFMLYTVYEYGGSYCDYLSLFWFYGQFERVKGIIWWLVGRHLEWHFLNLILGLAWFYLRYSSIKHFCKS